MNNCCIERNNAAIHKMLTERGIIPENLLPAEDGILRHKKCAYRLNVIFCPCVFLSVKAILRCLFATL
ncbi:MAG: hypothetical protein J6S94_02680, partial [Bacteroidaceae bacterium]|nr:hypothetical protein [Bacteroidaceae bacterium]